MRIIFGAYFHDFYPPGKSVSIQAAVLFMNRC
jgi:hypothetical protein